MFDCHFIYQNLNCEKNIYIPLIEDFYLREMFRQKRYQKKIRIGLQPEKKKKKKKMHSNVGFNESQKKKKIVNKFVASHNYELLTPIQYVYTLWTER